MKKNLFLLNTFGQEKNSLLLFSRWSFVLLFYLALTSAGFAQKERINLDLSNVSLQTLFREIQKQTGLHFVYNDEQCQDFGNVTVRAMDEEVTGVLDKVFAGRNFFWRVNEGMIMIKQQEKQAQTLKALKISGKVTDTRKNPLPGVSVYIKGSTLGVATDVQGNFSINITEQKDLVLMFSFIGMKSKEVAVRDQTVVNVVLEDNVSDLDEVKVIAYGKTTKRESMGAISTVKGEDIVGIPTANLSTLLQGRVAGMDVANMSGAPGAGGTATILRGYNTLNREQRDFSAPLWVVDGIPLTTLNSAVTGTNVLAEIDPEMIESIEVLKDAAATSMYGSRAANGVILITTKKGRAGDRIIKANVSYSVSYVPKYPTVLAGNEARRYKMDALRNYRAAYKNADGVYVYPDSYEEAHNKPGAAYDYFWGNGGSWGAKDEPILQDSLNPFYNNATNWFDRFFQAGKVVAANLQALYGTDRFNCSVGGAYYDETGILRGSGFTRFNFMTNLGFKPADRLSVDVSLALSYARRKRNQEETNSNSVMDAGQNLIGLPDVPFSTSPFLPGNSIVEEVVLQKQKGLVEKNEDIKGRLSIVVGYDFADWLRFTTTNSLAYSLSNQNQFTSSELSLNGNSKSRGQFWEDRTLLTENMLVFHKKFKEHKLEVLAGVSAQLDETHVVSGSGEKGPNDYVHYVGGGWPSIDNTGYAPRAMKSYGSDYVKAIMVSYMGRFSYSFRQKYLLGASVRRDGSSKFGMAVPWGTFPSASVGWVFSDESFMDFLGILDFAKLRGSWGVTGSQFSAAYLAYGELDNKSPFMGNSVVRPSIRGLRNADLSWERTEQYNLGIDLDLFNYRFGAVFDYYNRYTSDLLYMIPLPGNYSIYNIQPANAGAISNRGVELTLKYEIFRRDNFKWRVNFNVARNWNRFEESHNDRDLGLYILGEPLNVIRRLQSQGVITDESQIPYKYTPSGDKMYLNPKSPNQFYTLGDMLYLDANGDGIIDPAGDAVYIGSPLPKAQGGFMTELQWNNFDFGINFTYSLGRTIVNASLASALEVTGDNLTGPLLADFREYTFWQKPGDITDFPKLAYNAGKNNFGIYGDQFVEDVNYLRMKSFIIGYTLPKSVTEKLRLAKVRAYISGENLFTWTNYTGMDPESVDLMTGFDNGRKYPLCRRFTVGLSVNF